jgi:hypothetical protein
MPKMNDFDIKFGIGLFCFLGITIVETYRSFEGG